MTFVVLPIFDGVIMDENPLIILIVVDTGYAGTHHSKYWMPIHYDTIEDGQNKKYKNNTILTKNENKR